LSAGDAYKQKAFSQKLTKGYTGVKKAFTLVRSRNFNGTGSAGTNASLQGALGTGGKVPCTSIARRWTNVEATMTEGDHMAAKHIPRTEQLP